MGRRLVVFLSVLAFLVVSFGLPPSVFAKKYKNYIIATATPGGTYYPVGVAIATLINVKLAKKGITATAITSAGSGENVQLLKNKEADFAILQGLFGSMAYNGKGLYRNKPQRFFYSVTALWPNVEHFSLLKKYVKTGNIMDLKGLHQRFSIGKRGSGTEGSGRTILGALGIDVGKDVYPVYLGYNPSIDAMINGRIAGANTPAGPPVAAITRLFAKMGSKKVAILNFTDEQLKKIDSTYDVWYRYIIKPGTYPGQKKPIYTIAQPNFLAVRKGVPQEDVYLIVKTIYENLPFLHNIHKATYYLGLDNAINGLPVPLAPGAAKYYKEKGVKIPAKLIAK
ncbi:TAXI family TRAP transporter solute-binding subunit [Hippea maritima]|uniref:TRAP transporter solute receptor, TAXI family n=1 Tax=Hippea maritima (strain ATCC 700847 / DSM 10411 / MH2) TaxID=760142 RepID=F2LX20_HIPMA|nr:TAXI family TRAP transporter solute-binding subunit [Hippea maritima]AEA34204.1 TRAP transporter solute receptor, TAXI family [Hippea maritima DSM 10411]